MAGGDIEGGAALALPVDSASGRGTVALFAATMLIGAFLVFSIQPLFARMVLPLLGGSPAVWNTAMVFFQSALLAGYGYAHLTSRWLRPRPQIALHLALLALAVISLPVAIDPAWSPPAEGMPVAWLVAVLTWSLGLPFLAVAATAPLLQKWFAATGHPAAGDPYFLYGASNLGSVLALLSYPLVVEPALTLEAQSQAWLSGYGALALGIAGCVLVAWRNGHGASGAPWATVERADSLSWGRRLHWLALSLVPSSLLLAVTAHITTDLAAVPLLWIVPLTLYLLTFVIVFARRPWPRHAWMVKLQPFLLIPLALFFTADPAFWIGLPMHLGAFFVTALVCHGELARRRPSTAHLTEFYFWMALGGMLGGVLAALIAPALFDAVWEYPIALVAACLLRPPIDGGARLRPVDLILPVIIALLLVAQSHATDLGSVKITLLVGFLCILPGGLALYALNERPLGFGAGMAAALGVALFLGDVHTVVDRGRSFFGVYAIQHDPAGYRLLMHGTTLHGAQHVDPALRGEPLTYYHQGGPLGQLFAALGARLRTVGVVGLGVGTTACYRRPGQDWTFYEIDPLVVRIATGEHFRYLADCAPDAAVVLGDARLTLARTERRYDLLILDAFSSDAIPMHLMTREALAIYLERLASGGVIAWHLSNRNLDLAPVVGDLIAAAGVVGWLQHDRQPPEAISAYRTSSSWVVIARRPEDLGALTGDPRWRRLQGRPGEQPWSDDFSNIVSALRWRQPK